uniref:Protein kinase domain-containing protein n=1 Tax=Helianthus annuus TaxID=4232 RepID=A0A251T022_HELAN
MGQNGSGSKRVRVKTGQLKKGCFGSGRNGFGSKRVRVGTSSGQTGFRVGLAYSTVGTPDYIAPEVLLKKGYGVECDWFVSNPSRS